MVWSLSKDDDGLEPAVPLPRRRDASYAMPSGHADSSIPPSVSSSPPPSSTVVVDPISQIPPSGSRVSSRRRAAEPTRILSARKIDELRAQAQVHHKTIRRQKVLQFVGWGLAGALAVAAGGLLAGGLLPRMQSGSDDDAASSVDGSAVSPHISPTAERSPRHVKESPLESRTKKARDASLEGASASHTEQRQVPAARPVSLEELEEESP